MKSVSIVSSKSEYYTVGSIIRTFLRTPNDANPADTPLDNYGGCSMAFSTVGQGFIGRPQLDYTSSGYAYASNSIGLIKDNYNYNFLLIVLKLQ